MLVRGSVSPALLQIADVQESLLKGELFQMFLLQLEHNRNAFTRVLTFPF